jgi:hypothetical protein
VLNALWTSFANRLQLNIDVFDSVMRGAARR